MQHTPEIVGGRYQVIKQLGAGGMGAVYEALDRLSGETIALKRVAIPTENLHFSSHTPSANLYLALAQEFRLMASLRHPNVNSVLDYGFDEGPNRQPYFTMELLKQAQSIFQASWKSDAARVAVLIQVLQALAYLHRRGIIHRDLKPANILVVNGQAKVLDFGLSVKREQVALSEIAGTLGYIAPEELLGDPPSEASDLYAIGVIAYEMFAGQPLFDTDDTTMLIENTINTLPKLYILSNKPIAAVLERLLAKDPADRFASAQAVIAALCHALDQPVPSETVEIRESFLQTARFVGRDAELQKLNGALGRAVNGSGSAWLISGESGSGKTRLLDELRTQALVQGVWVLRSRNISEGAGLYQMWRPILRWLCLVTALEAAEASVLKELVPDIHTLLGQDVPDAPAVSPLFAQERLLITIEAVFRRQTHPMLLILEDLHWAGSESLDLLTRLIQIIPEKKLLIVGSYRDDERSDLAGFLPHTTLITLRRLTDDNIAELSAAMLGDEGRQPKLLQLLRRETEGNVFFLVEVMRSLAEQAGQLDRVVAMSLPGQVSAQGIDQIIQRRLQRVPAESRAMLQLAAVMGRQLDIKLLHYLAEPGFDVEHWLAVCLNTAVLDIEDGTWQFTHDKLRDGVLAELPAEQRSALHRKVGQALEVVYLYARERVASARYHWSMAGDQAKEAHYAAQLGKQALENGAYQQAVDSFERALILQSAEAGSKLATLKRQAAEAYLGLENTDRARDLFTQSLADCEAADSKWGMATAHNDLGSLAYTLHDTAQADQHFRAALKIATSIREPKTTLIALIGIASLFADQGQRERAVELARLVVEHAITDNTAMDRAQRLLNRLKIDLPPEVVAEAEKRGAALRLSDTARALLNT